MLPPIGEFFFTFYTCMLRGWRQAGLRRCDMPFSLFPSRILDLQLPTDRTRSKVVAHGNPSKY